MYPHVVHNRFNILQELHQKRAAMEETDSQMLKIAFSFKIIAEKTPKHKPKHEKQIE